MHCGKCSLELKSKGCRKTDRKLQLPRGDEAGLFPSLAVARWEGVGTLSAYVGEKAGLGEVWQTSGGAAAAAAEGRFGGRRSRGVKTGWEGRGKEDK